jgi:hypothetical protein
MGKAQFVGTAVATGTDRVPKVGGAVVVLTLGMAITRPRAAR